MGPIFWSYLGNTHTHIYIYIHAYIHTYMYIYIHTHIQGAALKIDPGYSLNILILPYNRPTGEKCCPKIDPKKFGIRLVLEEAIFWKFWAVWILGV